MSGTVGKARRQPWRAFALATVLAGIMFAARPWTFALDPALDVSQYAHTSWKIREGFPNALIYSIAQTADGYLWLGTEQGLFRFDGERAVAWQPPANQHLPSIATKSLLVARDGTLWIGTWNGLASWKNSKLIQYPQLAGLLIMGLAEEADGTVWAAGFASNPPGKLCAIQNETVHCYGEDGTLGKGPVGLYQDKKGNLWVGVLDGLWRWKPGPAQFYPIAGESIGVQGLVQGDDGALLISMTGRVARLVGGKPNEAYSYPSTARKVFAGTLLSDRDGSVWVGTAGRGLVHVHQGKIDAFEQSDGLSGNFVTALFQDREANIWVATTTGLDRFHEFAVVTFSENQGVPATEVVLAARDGTVWEVAPDGLRRWSPGQVMIYHEPSAKGAARQSGTTAKLREVTLGGLSNNRFASLAEDDYGRIWVAGTAGVGYLDHDRFTPVSQAPAGVVYSMVGDAKGNLWIANLDRGLFHLFRDKLVQQIPWRGLGRQDIATALASDPLEGGVWIGFSKGGLAHFSDGQIRTSYTATDGLGEGRVNDLRFDDEGTLWAATQGGLSRVKNGRVATVTSKNGLPCDIVHWVIEDPDHSFWLNMPCGLVRIAHSELDAWALDANRTIQTTLFNSSDGVWGKGDTPQQNPNVAKSPDGKLWFVTYEGLSVLDPRHLPINQLPPPVHIEQVMADHQIYDVVSDSEGQMRLPPRVRDLQIDYTALSFVAPEKVLFRYKLEGWDRDWQDVGTRRQAFYNNLPPRNYRFRVMACNNSGVWNETGTFLDFSVAPAYYQTYWFRVSCIAAFLVLLWEIYRLRVLQLRQQFAIGLEARVGERTRIARDLHDTLLQSFQGLMLHFQTGIDLLPGRPAEARKTLETALDRADQAIAEGRDAVQGLRTSTVETNDLASAVKILGEELRAEHTHQNSALFEMEVEGTPRNLHPILRDEVYRIAGEAMRNAFRHARAQRIEVQILYGERWLRLRVRDDGKGIDPKLLSGDGLTGHYGLHGMRERAKLVGGRLTVWSKLDSGTEVELSIPASTAYAKPARHRSWLSERFTGKGTYFKETDVKETDVNEIKTKS